MAKTPALGKGLGALINQRIASPAPAVELGERVQRLALEKIVASPLQPRESFAADVLGELVESIREKGIIQPLIVRKVGTVFELIAGERRWRAARELKLKDAPVIVREASDREVLELALIENLQREDLNPMEEALAYERLHKDFGTTQEEIAKRVGKSRAAVANAIRLLALHPDIKGYLKTARLSVGHAKVLLSIKSPDEQKILAEEILRLGASVRTTEKMAVDWLAGKRSSASGGGSNSRTTSINREIEPAIRHIENLLTHRLSTRVSLQHASKRGTITIEYYGQDDLNRLLKEFGVGE